MVAWKLDTVSMGIGISLFEFLPTFVTIFPRVKVFLLVIFLTSTNSALGIDTAFLARIAGMRAAAPDLTGDLDILLKTAIAMTASNITREPKKITVVDKIGFCS